VLMVYGVYVAGVRDSVVKDRDSVVRVHVSL